MSKETAKDAMKYIKAAGSAANLDGDSSPNEWNNAKDNLKAAHEAVGRHCVDEQMTSAVGKDWAATGRKDDGRL